MYYIRATEHEQIFELGAVYGLLHAWSLGKCTQDSAFWRGSDTTREELLGVLEMPMVNRIAFDTISVSNLDCSYASGCMTICFESESDIDVIQNFINYLAEDYDVNYAASLAVTVS